MPCDEQPIHSARSFALASEVDSATMRHFESIWLEMYRMREITTSRIGPTCAAIMTMMIIMGAPFDDAVRLGWASRRDLGRISADLAADEVHLVDDEQRDALHVLALLPPAREHVPPLRRRDDNRRLLEQLQVRRGLAGKHRDLGADRAERLAPRSVALLGESLQRRDVHAARAGARRHQPQHGELGADGLTRAGRRADQRVVVR